jgi:competence protein ComEA
MNFWIFQEFETAFQPRLAQPLQKITSEEILGETEGDSSTDSVQIKASITGQVVEPGVYSLEAGSLVDDLIRAAGGYTDSADLIYVAKNINLAEQLIEGTQIYIPDEKDEEILLQSDSNDLGGGDKLVNLNSATKSELTSLPGIGPATADKIIAGRPYEKIEDLLEVSGIGDSTLNKLEGRVSL